MTRQRLYARARADVTSWSTWAAREPRAGADVGRLQPDPSGGATNIAGGANGEV